MATSLPGIQQAALKHGLEDVVVLGNTVSFEDGDGRLVVIHQLANIVENEWRVDVYRTPELMRAGYGPGKRAVFTPLNSGSLLQAALTFAQLEPIVNLDADDDEDAR